jgi:ATP-dependent helicase/nuclease subunit B
MRETIGLSPPERRVGLAAHDFAQALGARAVYLTRALKVDGVPTVPSRWLQRLLALIEAAGLEQKIEPARPWVAWARERDRTPSFEPVKPPQPRPPVAARPRQMSVTRIERWIANPYEIYAQSVLELEKMQQLGAEPDAAMRGQIIHRVLQVFSRAFPGQLPVDVAGELNRIADEHFAKLDGSPLVAAFWRPHFRRFARWFAATEPARRRGVARILTEAKGLLDLPVGGGFRLTARADRIDVGENGAAVIYDYKTGKPPLPKHVEEFYAPQLSLSAAIAEQGGFEGLVACEVSGLAYIHVSGRNDGGEEQPAAKIAPSVLAALALEKLNNLVARYADKDMPYEVKRRSAQAFRTLYRYDDYEHLARVKEWLTQEVDEEYS